MKIKSLLFYLLFGIVNFVNAQNVSIPDNNFKLYLISNPSINTNGDTEIQISEAEAFTGVIDCSNKNISNLTGIQKFINITELICHTNSLTYLSLSENKKLIKVHCSNNLIDYLDVSTNLSLIELICSNNQLSNINISNNILLKTFLINFNSQLKNLDLSKNINLETLYIYGNDLNTVDLSQNSLLKVINVGRSNFSEINLNYNTNLEELYIGNTQLTSLDLSKNIKLKILDCFDNLSLTSLDVSKNEALIDFRCARNAIISLDVSKNTLLQMFYCHENNLTSLDVKTNTNLKEFSCFGNQITNLDVSNNSLLTLLSCRDNQLNSLNIKNGNNTLLSIFRAANNPSLSCIQVDDVSHANSQPDWLKDPTANYNTNCLLSTTNTHKDKIKIYPNPVKDILNFSEELLKIEIFDVSGKKVKLFSNPKKSINISALSEGNYIILLTTKDGKTQNQNLIME